MTFDVEVGSRARRVSVEALDPAGAAAGAGRFRVVLDGVPHVVDARRTDLGWSLVFEDSSRSIDVAVTEQARGDVLVQFPHIDVTVGIDGRRFHRDALDAAQSAQEPGVTAPMPGRVVRVLVEPGAEVAARQAVVVVEAMKMENELTAPRAGRVTEVLVSEGQSVEAGRLLVRLDETESLKT